MDLLITNIKSLAQTRDGKDAYNWVAGANMAKLPSIENAFLLIEDGLIADF